MKKFFSFTPLHSSTFLYLLGCIVLIVGIFFFPISTMVTWSGSSDFSYIWGYSGSVQSPALMTLPLPNIFLVLLLYSVMVALPLLSLCFVLGISTARLFRGMIAKNIIWYRRATQVGLIGAIVGLTLHILLGVDIETIGEINAQQTLDIGFYLVLLGFTIMIVGASCIIKSTKNLSSE
jgi:hypothetical protein